MNYGSEPADQVVRYSLEGAEFALRISGTAAKNFFIFAQAVLHDSKKTHGKTHLIRLLKEQKPLRFFTVVLSVGPCRTGSRFGAYLLPSRLPLR